MCRPEKCPDSVRGMAAMTPHAGGPEETDRAESRETGEAAPSAPRTTADSAGRVRMTAWVRGEVQGVGFRWFTRAAVLRIGGLVGYVSNLDDGRVQIVAEGPRDGCDRILEWLRGGDTPGRVEGVTELFDQPRGGYTEFAIR